MHAHATVTLAHHGLELRCPTAQLREDRPLADADVAQLQHWAARHQKLARARQSSEQALLDLGREVFAWLNGDSSFLSRLLDTSPSPLLVEFTISKADDSPQARAFLDAPWELLADDTGPWALDPTKAFCPVRRVGAPLPPPPPGPHCLGLVFMAAAPHGADNLDFEAEEASILHDTRHLRLDLAVEESGTLELLSACVAREQPDVVQISCHGALKPKPGLLLEDEVGDRVFTETSDLVDQLAAAQRRLVFLSACETAEAHPVLDSLARSLVRSGAPAVLGWAAPVLDNEATLFAAGLYARLVKGDDLVKAHVGARSQLLNTLRKDSSSSCDWHLARLYLAPTGGGVMARADAPQRHLGQGQAVKTFLDAKGKQVPVAGAQEFVGRRREIQKILREFRAPPAQRHAGVFIHGVGRQGKSSLAARVAHRLEHSHETVVIYGRYDAPYLLGKFAERLGTPAVTDITKRHLPRVEADPAQLLPALTELLEGPCAQAGAGGAKPVLLVIDDFEQALDDQNHRTLRPAYVESIRALLLAFQHAATGSHLLFTCRFQFTCPHGGRDLADADHLLDVPLHGMEQRESQKQASAKLRLPDFARRVAKLKPERRETLERQIARAIVNARGNPGLQDLLFTLAVDDSAACERCLAQMEAYLQGGALPTEDRVRAFLENLALDSLIGLLTPVQRELLRATTLFELPVPLAVMEQVADRAGGPAPAARHGAAPAPSHPALARLLALGLVEAYEDLHDPQEPALALNALARPLAGTLSDAEQAALAGVVTDGLFARWGGETGGKQRGSLQDHELTRLGLLARDARVLAATGADTLRYLRDLFQYRRAAAWAKAIPAIVDAAGLPASVDLLRTAAESCQQVGEVKEAKAFLERAIPLLGSGAQADTMQNVATLLTHARVLVEEGQPDAARRHLEHAKDLLPPGREQAIVLGDIARIRADKGEVDAALCLHEEKLSIVEALGDKRSRAVTLGDIARIRADRGEVAAALRLHEEELAVYEALGDMRSRAVTLGDIARLRADKGEVDAALRLHEEALAVHEALGDKRSRAVTLGDIARIRADKGEVDAALRLHEERLAVYEALGDKRSQAVTLGDIARLRADKGEVDAALRLHEEALAIYEALGNMRSRAVTLGDIARIRANKGEVDAALQLHEEKLSIVEALGDKRSQAVTLGDIARLRADKGEVDAALRLHEEALAVHEALGDMDGKANTLWSIAQIEVQQEKWQEAFGHLAESYAINLKLGRLDGICFVGLDLGQLLCMAGEREQGLAILTRSLDGFLKLGRQREARHTQGLIDQISQLPPPAEG